MKHHDPHPSNEQLLLDIDGELAPPDEKAVRAHLEGCWKCRARRADFEQAIADFARAHFREFETQLPSAEGPRALLKAQLARLPRDAPSRLLAWSLAAAACGALVLGLSLMRAPHTSALVVSTPDSTLTPGAAILTTRQAVCGQPSVNNRAVPVALQRKVFEAYRITGAEPRAYEIDYLVTPALGGADDIHNLWPHSYSATLWNAAVKDALEDRLREMVCNGSLDLADAQRDIARNWIAAYKKYFHTDLPLAEHRTAAH
jgi:hypothetical protein